MKAKTYAAQYELIEFNHYMDHNKDKSVSVVDLIIESDDIDFIQKEFDHLFVINTDSDSYAFLDYKLTECYDVGGGLTRVICVK